LRKEGTTYLLCQRLLLPLPLAFESGAPAPAHVEGEESLQPAQLDQLLAVGDLKEGGRKGGREERRKLVEV